MGFMVPVDHTFKIADRSFADGTEIDVDTQKDCDKESGCNMQQIGQVQSTGSQKAVDCDLRVKQPDP